MSVHNSSVLLLEKEKQDFYRMITHEEEWFLWELAGIFGCLSSWLSRISRASSEDFGREKSRNVYLLSLHHNPRSAQKYDLFSTILFIFFRNLAIHVAVSRDLSVSRKYPPTIFFGLLHRQSLSLQLRALDIHFCCINSSFSNVSFSWKAMNFIP